MGIGLCSQSNQHVQRINKMIFLSMTVLLKNANVNK